MNLRQALRRHCQPGTARALPARPRRWAAAPASDLDDAVATLVEEEAAEPSRALGGCPMHWVWRERRSTETDTADDAEGYAARDLPVIMFKARLAAKLQESAPTEEEKNALAQLFTQLKEYAQRRFARGDKDFEWNPEQLDGMDKAHYQVILQWSLGWRELDQREYETYMQDFEPVYRENCLNPSFACTLMVRAGFVQREGNLIRMANLPKLVMPTWAEELTHPGEEVVDECAAIREDILERSYAIDDPSTYEVDDAISVNGDWYYVHVADVSRYVPWGNDINRLAQQRVTTTYFTDAVHPMLPDSVVEVCTLKPHPKRSTTLSVGMRLGTDGSVMQSRIFPGKTTQCHRITYEEANALIVSSGAGADMPPGLRAVAEATPVPQWAKDEDAAALGRLYATAKVLKARRVGAGALVMHNPEWRVQLDSNKKSVENVYLNPNQWVFDSHKVVEEFMLLAGHTVAQLCVRQGILCAFRATQPTAESDNTADNPAEVVVGSSAVAQQQSAEAAGEAHRKLRGMKAAFYVAEPLRHVALNNVYSHFTSPLRRYPDLLNHYQIKDYLLGGQKDVNSEEKPEVADDALAPIAKATLPGLCEYISRKSIHHRRMQLMSRNVYILQYVAKLCDPAVGGDAQRTFRCYVAETQYVGVSRLHAVPRGDNMFCSTVVMLQFGVITELYHSDRQLVAGTLVDCRVESVVPHVRSVVLQIVAVCGPEDEATQDPTELATMAEAITADASYCS